MQDNFFKKKDLIVILILILIAGIIYYFTLPGEKMNVAEIKVDGEIYDTVRLSEENDGIYKIDGLNVEYEIREGKIRFYSSDCPDKVCIGDGFISLGGESAVCLPNRVIIYIPRGGLDSDVDIMLH